MFAEQAAREVLCAPCLAFDAREEIGIGDVGLVGGIVKPFVENCLQVGCEFLRAAHKFHEAVHIVRHIERVVPGIALVEPGARLEVLTLAGVERREEGAVGQQGTERAVFGTEVFAPAEGTLAEEPGIIGLAQSICPKGEGIVGHVVFERVAHGIVELALERHVAEAHVVVVVGTHGIVLTRCEGTAAGGGVGGLNVEIAQAFEIAVCKDGNGGVAFHRERFASVKFPFRQPAPLLSHARHRAQHVGLPLGIDEREQLVDVAVGVPEGEHGVAVVPRRHCADAVALH